MKKFDINDDLGNRLKVEENYKLGEKVSYKGSRIVDFKGISNFLYNEREYDKKESDNDLNSYYELDFFSDGDNFDLSEHKETRLKDNNCFDILNFNNIKKNEDIYRFDDCIDYEDENLMSKNSSVQSIESINFVNLEDLNSADSIKKVNNDTNRLYVEKEIFEDLDNKLSNSRTSNFLDSISSTLKIVEEKLNFSKLNTIEGIKKLLTKSIKNNSDISKNRNNLVYKNNSNSQVLDSKIKNNYMNFLHSRNGYDTQSNESILSDESIRYPNLSINGLIDNNDLYN